MRKSIKYILAAAAFACVIFTSCKDNDAIDGKNVEQGTRIVETGELAAVETRAFVLPRFGRYWYQMKIIGILKHGTIVKAGDSIIQLDGSEIRKFIVNRKSDLETHNALIEKMKVDQSNRMQDLESRLKSEEASFDLRKLELESSRFESDRIKRIKELEFQQSKIQYDKVINQVKLAKVIIQNDLQIQLIRQRQITNELQQANDLLSQLTIRTPIPGVFQVGENWRSGKPIQIGDDIYQGTNMGNVPNLQWMKVNSTVSEQDFQKVKVGQKVTVRLDAMPKLKFEGEVTYIGKLCRLKDQKSRQKVFDVEIKILKSDERLKPGMTVSCEYH